MNITKTVAVFSVVVAVSGCGSPSTPSAPPAMAAAPRPVAAPAPAAAASCAMATQAVDTCRIKDPPFSRKRMICEIWVGGAPDQLFVYPYQVNVPVLPDRSMPVIFVWKLLDRNFRFADPANGPTSPTFKGTSTIAAEFTDGTTASDDDGESGSGGVERRYRWKFAHPGTAKEYSYNLQVQVPDPQQASGWTTLSCDPTIKSSGN